MVSRGGGGGVVNCRVPLESTEKNFWITSLRLNVDDPLSSCPMELASVPRHEVCAVCFSVNFPLSVFSLPPSMYWHVLSLSKSDKPTSSLASKMAALRAGFLLQSKEPRELIPL